jgi:hypothetical protein
MSWHRIILKDMEDEDDGRETREEAVGTDVEG